jgi:hypothetical protein
METPRRVPGGEISIFPTLRILLPCSAPAADYRRVFQGDRGTPADMRVIAYVRHNDTHSGSPAWC